MTALSAPARRPRPWTYTRIDTVTTLRRPDMLFFTVVMPLGMYLFYGAMQDYSDTSVGHGNVAASTMINMAVFSVAIAATCTAAGAAVEQAGGWGRQVALTPGGLRLYILTKLAASFLVAAFPVTVIFIAGTCTGAHMDGPGTWAASYVLTLLTAVPFACYGLAVGLWVPAQAAVGIAGASISVFAFLGNLFMPLGGGLFAFGRWTPIYGSGSLATRVLQDDVVATATGTVQEALWIPVTNIAAWTSLFIVLCLLARHRATARR